MNIDVIEILDQADYKKIASLFPLKIYEANIEVSQSIIKMQLNVF